MKQLLLHTFFILLAINLQAHNNNFNIDQIKLIEGKINLIQEKYKNHEIEQFKVDLNLCLKTISVLKISVSKDSVYQRNLNILIETFNKIEYADFIIDNIELEKEKYTDRYFEIWDKMFRQKLKVDRLYTKVNVNENIALNQKSEFLTFRKKNLYDVYNKIYNLNLSKLKKLNECDYKNKIDVIISTISLLDAFEKLLLADNTKTLEKSLKKITDIDEMKKILNAHQLSKDIIWF